MFNLCASAKKEYDEAESLLLRAYQLENKSSSAATSRAATLQQIGRVCLRKGKIEDAQTRLREALELYKGVYGAQRACLHINVATVRHQLGLAAARSKCYDVAVEELNSALATKQRIYGQHIEVALELESLARVEFERGNFTAALLLFQQEGNMLNTLISIESAKTSLSFDLSIDQHRNKLKKLLLSCLFFQRNAAKKTDDVQLAANLMCEINNIKKQCQMEGSKPFDSTHISCVLETTDNDAYNNVLERVKEIRKLIRNMLLNANNSNSNEEHNEAIDLPVLHAKKLSRLHEIISILTENLKSVHCDTIAFGGEEQEQSNRKIVKIKEIIALFIEEILNVLLTNIVTSSNVYIALADNKRLLFAKCDEMRHKLQAIGVSCVDS